MPYTTKVLKRPTPPRASAPEIPQQRMLSATEVAERIGVHRQLVWAYIKHGKLRASRVGHGRGVWKISEEALAAFLSAGEL